MSTQARAAHYPFHVALAVRDLAEARAFYTGFLGCREGRSDVAWADFNLFGHQLVCHLRPESVSRPRHNPVDGDAVPIPHCGVVLPLELWRDLAERLAGAGAEFVIRPRTRFRGEAGEQGTFFLADPSGNVLEFKGFRNLDDLFATARG